MSHMSESVPPITIRPATWADVAQLEALPYSAGLRSKHTDRLGRQERDEVRYLLAVQGERIIGHLLLKWDCPEDPHVRSLIPPCAEVEDFVVAPDRRGAGVGSQMLDFAGLMCTQRGISRLGNRRWNRQSRCTVTLRAAGIHPRSGFLASCDLASDR